MGLMKRLHMEVIEGRRTEESAAAMEKRWQKWLSEPEKGEQLPLFTTVHRKA